MFNLCACGCGNSVTKEKNAYITGHYNRKEAIKERKQEENKLIQDENKDIYIQKSKDTSDLLDLLNMTNLEKLDKHQTLIQYLFMKDVILLLKDIKGLLKRDGRVKE